MPHHAPMAFSWRYYYEKCMYAWAVLAHSWVLVQIITIFRSKNASGLSLAAWIIFCVSSIVWIIYGAFVMKVRNYVIITSSSTALILGIIILVGIVLYGSADGTDADAGDDPVG